VRSSRRLLISFAVAACLYLVAAMVTIGTTGHPLRPLYEGVGPAAPYRWVHPPAAFKATNVPPLSSTQTIPLTPAGTAQTGSSAVDAQLVMNLPGGAIPASAPNTSVLLSITPVDPAKLGRLPPGLYSNGNAYLVTASYQPNKLAIPGATKPIDAVLRTPVPSVALLTSPDGKTWDRLTDHHIPGQAAVATTFTRFGYLLAAANVPVVTSSSSSRRILLVVILAVVAALVLGASLVLRRRR
jgi:hypothetical protein